MINIKDFKVGEKACLCEELNGATRRFLLKEVDVFKIGRKYVTVKVGAWDFRFEQGDYENDALVEVTDYGARKLLFPDTECAERYIEREELMAWLVSRTNWNYRRSYSVDQLRAVKRILENKGYKEYEHREEAYGKI